MKTQIGGTHYLKYPVSPINWALDNHINAAEFSILRYLLRYRDKNGIEDLDKAIHYVQILMRHGFITKNQDAIDRIEGFCTANRLSSHQRAALVALFEHDYTEFNHIIQLMRREYE